MNISKYHDENGSNLLIKYKMQRYDFITQGTANMI